MYKRSFWDILNYPHIREVLSFSYLQMEIGLCEQLLQNAYQKNPTGLENISQLTSTARGKDKAVCMQLM